MQTVTTIDPRKLKRFERKSGMSDPVYMAYLEGQCAAFDNQPRNPYPPGRRHDAFDEGYNQADPMGDHHGRNY